MRFRDHLSMWLIGCTAASDVAQSAAAPMFAEFFFLEDCSARSALSAVPLASLARTSFRTTGRWGLHEEIAVDWLVASAGHDI